MRRPLESLEEGEYATDPSAVKRHEQMRALEQMVADASRNLTVEVRAAVAQATQLARIADALDTISVELGRRK